MSEFPQRRRAAIAIKLLEQFQRLQTRLLVWVLFVELLGMNHVNLCVGAVAETVHPSESLGHALKGRQIANEVVGGDVDPDLAGAGADEINGAYGGGNFLPPLCRREEACKDGIIGELIPLQSAKSARKLLHRLIFLFESGPDLLHVFHGGRENQDAALGALELQSQLGNLVREFLPFVPHGQEMDCFAGLDPTPQVMNRLRRRIRDIRRRIPLSAGECEDVALVGRLLLARRSCQCHDSKRAELLASFLFVPDLDQQFLKSRLQVGLVVDEQHILPEEPRVERLASEADAVAAEQQPAADHVHSADDNRWPGGIGRPLPIVGELTAKRADRQDFVVIDGGKRGEFLTQSLQDRAILGGQFALSVETVAELLDFVGCLIDDRPAVDDIDKPTRQLLGAVGQGDQPHGHYGGLAEAGGDVARRRHMLLPLCQKFVERPLPGERIVSCQHLECAIEVNQVIHWRIPFFRLRSCCGTEARP